MNKPILTQMCSGYCPESALKGKRIRMRLNHWDFYESEETGLQVALIRPMFAVILKFRGEGKFRTTPEYLDEVVDAEFWSPQITDNPPFVGEGAIFKDENEIKEYLSKIPPDNINRKDIYYYSELAYNILNDFELPYLSSKNTIYSLFIDNNKLDNYNDYDSFQILNARLSLIDGFYSTNVNSRRLYAIEQIVNEITDYADSDNEFINKIDKYLKIIENEYDVLCDDFFDFNDFITKNYGINKIGEKSGVATSLLTKYLYFITNFQFPIFDNLVKKYHKEIAKRFNISLKIDKNKNISGEINVFVSNMIQLNKKIDDFNKLDNLIWLFGKIKTGSYSLILTEDKYLKLIDFVKKYQTLKGTKSDKIDKIISETIEKHLDEIEQADIFYQELYEFVEFVYNRQ